MSSSKVWLITGCSSGFGNELSKAALRRGDKVIATARNAAKLESLKAAGASTLALDITAGDEKVQKVIDEAVKMFGRIDILVNNAAYGLQGAVEECSDEEAKAQFETNFFGQLTVIRAVLPHMRGQKSGVIANFGSIGGWFGVLGGGFYSATKFALVGITDSLRQENAHLGIECTIIEPGYFRTNLASSGSTIIAEKVIDDLRPVMDPLRHMFAATNQKQPGDPAKAAQLLVEVLTKSGRYEGKPLPLRLPLGRDAVGVCRRVLEKETKSLNEWAELVSTTDHDDVVQS
ncbi:unnamed protein product [Calypogeia fissa]